MKALLISIKPKWVSKILNGEKTIEVRKTMPKCDLPIDVYIYCTTTGKVLYEQFEKCVDGKIVGIHWNTDENEGGFYGFNGRVVAKFTLNKVGEFDSNSFQDVAMKTVVLDTKTLKTTSSCLSYNEINNYLKGKKGYAWHISNLIIFDRPRELGEFKHYNKPSCDSCPFQYSIECDYHREVECDDIPLTKAPQSYQFIEVKE